MSTWEGPGVKDKELGLGSGWLPQRAGSVNKREEEEEISGREAGYGKRKEGARHKGPHFHHSISKRHIQS